MLTVLALVRSSKTPETNRAVAASRRAGAPSLLARLLVSQPPSLCPASLFQHAAPRVFRSPPVGAHAPGVGPRPPPRSFGDVRPLLLVYASARLLRPPPSELRVAPFLLGCVVSDRSLQPRRKVAWSDQIAIHCVVRIRTHLVVCAVRQRLSVRRLRGGMGGVGGGELFR